MTAPYMPDNLAQIRQKRLLEELDSADLDALVLNAGPSLSYLTNLHFHLSERPVVAIFRTDGLSSIVLPELEVDKVRALPYEMRTFTYGEDPLSWPRAFEAAAADAGLDYRRVGVEPTRLRVLELRFLEEAAPRAAYLSASSAIDALRVVKDEAEIASIRKAVKVAESALRQTLENIHEGMTEVDLERELTLQLFRAGSASELPFTPIVAFGPNSANPHAAATDRPLGRGDLILIDWGATVNGYCSDLTRVFAFGRPEDEITDIIDIVEEANRAARAKAGPGVTTGDVDRAARGVIQSAGYGSYFTHRTGHGLGLDGHESPYIRHDSEEVLAPGMVFTIEPGIYLPGRGGARIEDDCLITYDGSESLSTLERRLTDLTKTEVHVPAATGGPAEQ